LSLSAQAPVFEDLIFEADSITTNYKLKSKNHAFIRSKRGTDGLTKTTTGDSLVAKKTAITDIYLVFTEMSSAEIATRETENRERWENMLKTYPEFFNESPNLYNVCQCSSTGNAESLKKTQGFYVYFEGKEEPVAVVPKVEPKKEVAEPKKKEKVEKVKEEKKTEPKEEKVAKAEKPVKKEKAEKPKKEKKEKEAVVVKEEVKEAPPVIEEVKVTKPKKEGYAKPRKAKDVKVCRPPCYEGGEEGLNEFLKENIVLSKKQKRKSGDLVSIVTLQLNFDGSIKKTLIQGTNEEFNKQVDEAVKKMDLWNPAVKGGVTIKSQVKLTLKYDNSTKSIKPFETMITPRPAPKCTECLSDSQVFAD
jgi:hypothetical protein